MERKTRAPVRAIQRRSMDDDDRLVEDALHHIRDLARQAMLDVAVAIGDYIVKHFFGGDLDLARSNDPTKPVALRRLLERADEMDVSSTVIRRSVSLSVQYRQLPPAVRGALSMRQQLALLPVADTREKTRIAEEALAKNLSGDGIARLVRRGRGPLPTGRPPRPVLERAVRSALRALEAPEVDDALASRAIRALDARTRRELLARLRNARERIERIADAVQRATAADATREG